MKHQLEMENQRLRAKIQELGHRLTECGAHLARTERERREAMQQIAQLREEIAGLQKQLELYAPSGVH